MSVFEIVKQKKNSFMSLLLAVKANKIPTIFYTFLVFVASTIAAPFVMAIFYHFFPQLDDTNTILQNQNTQFELMRQNLSKIEGTLSGKDQNYIKAAFSSMKSLKNESDNLAKYVVALKDENESLNQLLKNEKGIDGEDLISKYQASQKLDSQRQETIKTVTNERDSLAKSITTLQAENNKLNQSLEAEKLNSQNQPSATQQVSNSNSEFVLKDNSGTKIDGQTSFGFRSNGLGRAWVSLTTVKDDKSVSNKGLDAGEGVPYTSENGKACNLIFNGNSNEGSDRKGSFSTSCQS